MCFTSTDRFSYDPPCGIDAFGWVFTLLLIGGVNVLKRLIGFYIIKLRLRCYRASVIIFHRPGSAQHRRLSLARVAYGFSNGKRHRSLWRTMPSGG